MVYEHIEERLMRIKCGDLDVYRGLIIEGCGSLYLYAAMIKESKEDRVGLVKDTYLSAWDKLQGLEIPPRFDVWLKGILWREAAICSGTSEIEVKKLAEEKVSSLLKTAFREAENYWYLPLREKNLLACDVIDDIRKYGRKRMN